MQPVVAIIGPTGSGKSALALAAAERLPMPVEIVAIDAFTIYRGMDIGTATPTAADRARTPHHMVDVLDPEEECSVSWFQARARHAIAAVQQRGALPLLVGGSGLYFRAVVDPLEFPPTDPAVRERIHGRWQDDAVAAHGHLSEQDPAAAARIDPSNLRRAVRALEVLELTGRPFSSFRTAWQHHDSIYPDLRVVGVEVDRPTLGRRLQDRITAMLHAGWVEEARALHDRELSETARQAIGYAELFDVLDGTLTREAAAERILVRTRRFAARQQRWFAGDPRVVWTAPQDVVDTICELARPKDTSWTS